MTKSTYIYNLKRDEIQLRQLNETAEFYKRLYTSEKTDNSSQNFLLNKMTRTLSDSNRGEREITLDEVRSAVINHRDVMD